MKERDNVEIPSGSSEFPPVLSGAEHKNNKPIGRKLVKEVGDLAQKRVDHFVQVMKYSGSRQDELNQRYAQAVLDTAKFLQGELDPDHPFAHWMFSHGVGRPRLGSDSDDA